MPSAPVPELTPEDLRSLAEDVRIVDARPRLAFAAGHIDGSLGIELADDFGVWVGWLLPFNSPIVLVLNDDQDLDETVRQLGRIGFDRVRGVLRGELDWDRTGRATSAYHTVGVAEFAAAIESGRATQILDVRSPSEWSTGHLPGSIHRYVPDLVAGVPEALTRDRPVWIACASGYRSTIAAGLLEGEGFEPVVLAEGGIPDVLERGAAARAVQHVRG